MENEQSARLIATCSEMVLDLVHQGRVNAAALANSLDLEEEVLFARIKEPQEIPVQEFFDMLLAVAAQARNSGSLHSEQPEEVLEGFGATNLGRRRGYFSVPAKPYDIDSPKNPALKSMVGMMDFVGVIATGLVVNKSLPDEFLLHIEFWLEELKDKISQSQVSQSEIPKSD